MFDPKKFNAMFQGIIDNLRSGGMLAVQESQAEDSLCYIPLVESEIAEVCDTLQAIHNRRLKNGLPQQ